MYVDVWLRLINCSFQAAFIGGFELSLYKDSLSCHFWHVQVTLIRVLGLLSLINQSICSVVTLKSSLKSTSAAHITAPGVAFLSKQAHSRQAHSQRNAVYRVVCRYLFISTTEEMYSSFLIYSGPVRPWEMNSIYFVVLLRPFYPKELCVHSRTSFRSDVYINWWLGNDDLWCQRWLLDPEGHLVNPQQFPVDFNWLKC